MARKAATVTWLTDMTFDVQMGSHHMTIDSAPTPEASRGPSPMQLVMAAVAGCTAMDVVSILRKSRQPFTRLVVRAEGDQVEDHPRRYDHVTVVYEVHGEGLDPAAVERAVRLSDERYCSVSASLKEAVTVSTRIELHDAAPVPTA